MAEARRTILGCTVRCSGPSPVAFLDAMERGVALYGGKPVAKPRPAPPLPVPSGGAGLQHVTTPKPVRRTGSDPAGRGAATTPAAAIGKPISPPSAPPPAPAIPRPAAAPGNAGLQPIYARLCRARRTVPEIAAELDKSEDEVRDDLKRMRLTAGEPKKARPVSRPPITQHPSREIPDNAKADPVCRKEPAAPPAPSPAPEATAAAVSEPPAPEAAPVAAERRRGRKPRAKPMSQKSEERAARFRELMLAGQTAAEIADAMGVSDTAVWMRAKSMDLTAAWRMARERRKAAAAAEAAGPAEEIASEPVRDTAFGPAGPAKEITPRGRPPAPPPSAPVLTHARGAVSTDKAAIRRAASNERARAKVRDRRRFKETPVPTGEHRTVLAADSPAVVEGRTTHPNKVLDPADPVTADTAILKDGAWNSKIGGNVLVGRLKGAKILTLSLEERATCPRSCVHWRTCMGVNDPHAVRWKHGAALMDRLWDEVMDLCERHEAVLIRLHYLGDFWSWEYVGFWRRLLLARENLHCFGFTAHPRESKIGSEIAHVRDAFPGQFSIRHSNSCYAWGSFTLDLPTAKKTIGEAIVCPEQADAMNGAATGRHCGSCGACWSCDRPIAFVDH